MSRPVAFALALALVVAAPSARAQAPTAKGAAPTKLWVAQTSATELTLVWDGPKGATGYEVGVRRRDGSVSMLGRFGPTVRRVVLQVQQVVRASGVADQLQLVIASVGDNLRSQWVDFNAINPDKASTAKSLVAPRNAGATERAPGVIRVSWGGVEGATAYAIGRAAGNEGFRMLCALCPTTTSYLDSVPTSGLAYRYSIAAITPQGTSPRVMTNAVTVRGAVVASGGAGGSAAPRTESGSTAVDSAGGKAGAKDALQQPPTQLEARATTVGGRRQVNIRFMPGVGAIIYSVLQRVCDGPLRHVGDLEPRADGVLTFIDDVTDLPVGSCAGGATAKGASQPKATITYVIEGKDAKGRTLQTKLPPVTVP